MKLDMANLVKWAESNLLLLNHIKTQVIVIGKTAVTPNSTFPNIIVNFTPMAFSKSVKNLGVIFECWFDWSFQVSKMCQRVYFSLHNLYKFRTQTPVGTRKRLALSLIMPIFDYCDITYVNMNGENLNRLQLAQNRVVRYILDINKRDHITPFYLSLSLLKIKERHELHALHLSHSFLHGLNPPYLSSLFWKRVNVTDRSTIAHTFSLQASRLRNNVLEKSFGANSYRLWNALPPKLCCNPNFGVFKRAGQCRLPLWPNYFGSTRK
jgi:hypothetical protein